MSSINPNNTNIGSPVRGRSQSPKRRAASRSESPQSIHETGHLISNREPKAVKQNRADDLIDNPLNDSINASGKNTGQDTVIHCLLSHDKLKKDPAAGSGVIVTTFMDIFSFFTFLGIASLGLKFIAH